MKKDEILKKLQSFKEKNQEKYSILKIGIFGSASQEKMNEKSDIDVVVELGYPDLFYLIGIKQDLEEIFHKTVDIIHYREKMNGFLKGRIEKEAIYI